MANFWTEIMAKYQSFLSVIKGLIKHFRIENSYCKHTCQKISCQQGYLQAYHWVTGYVGKYEYETYPTELLIPEIMCFWLFHEWCDPVRIDSYISERVRAPSRGPVPELENTAIYSSSTICSQYSNTGTEFLGIGHNKFVTCEKMPL